MVMNKSSNNSSLNNLHLDEDWSSHPAIEWITSHKSVLLWGVCAFVAILILSLRLITWRTIDAERDFFQAQTAFNQFEQTAASTENVTALAELEQLQAIMQRHPELEAKYQGALTQTLLITGPVSQAQIYMDDIFKRNESAQLQMYQHYTTGSLLIAQKRYPEALQNAKQLKFDLEQLGEESNSILYVFNLVRLATLYQHLEQSQDELNAWLELQNQPQRLDAVHAANQAFQVGNASLNQYIEERKKVLTH